MIFIKETHEYYHDGRFYISVSKVLRRVFPDKYKGIPLNILKEKAEHGKRVHDAVHTCEVYESSLETTLKWFPRYVKLRDAIKEYFRLKKEHKFKVISTEQIVFNDYVAGTYDLEIKIGKKIYLVDIKTTSELDEEYVSWQLSIYEELKGKKYDGLFCIWIPIGQEAEFVKIKRIHNKKIKKILKEIEEERK